MLHLYWGNGKGKTTAAMGLALRALAVSLPLAAAVHPLLAWVRTRALDD